MDTKTVYSTKTEKYAKYRWDYAPEAIESIFKLAQVDADTTIADIGAGTGILTKYFAGKVRQIYALEPNAELRNLMSKELYGILDLSVLDSCAENTELPTNSIDVITVAQAIHWFDPEPAKEEMLRILKDDGWLVLVRNYGTDQPEKAQALENLMTEEYGADYSVVTERPEGKPNSFYFGHADFTKLIFPFSFYQNWDEFIGALMSASFMPDEDHPLFGKFEAKAREIFAQYSLDGRWLVEGETELIIGQPR